jgi:hypothetical protein
VDGVQLRKTFGSKAQPLSRKQAERAIRNGGTEPINPGKLSDRFVSVRGLAHLRNIGFHSLRKYFVTSLLAAGVPRNCSRPVPSAQRDALRAIWIVASRT